MLRNLSALESFYVTNNINIVTICDLTGTVNPLILKKAIQLVVMSHPLLSSSIITEDDQMCFAKRDSFNDKMVCIGQVDKFLKKEIILTELNKPLETSSLVRFTLLLERKIGIIASQAISLIITTHHAVSDGLSCVALQQQLWKVYSQLVNNQNPDLMEQPLLPAIEQLIPANFSEHELKEYVDTFTNKQSNFKPFTVKPNEKNDSAISLSYTQKKFSIKQTQQLIERCKENNASIDSVICAANLFALRDLFATDDAIDLSLHIPINIRKLLEPKLEHNAMLSAAIGCAHHESFTKETNLWSLATAISETIKTHIEQGDLFKSLLTYEQTRLTTTAATSIGISNIGIVNTQKLSQKLKLEGIQCIPSIPLPMLSAFVVTSDNKLLITYPFAKPFFSSSQIKRIADAAIVYLLY
jgi:NRPS condensation-like uncharacterized protein